jgi:DNA-binding transcriptional MerR regulator
VALKEYKAEKQLYTMGEVTEMFDVKPSLIRFWSERFDVLKPRKNKKGNRLFTPDDVRNLETIYHLTKERGMTLAGVDKYLKTNREDADRETEIVRRLQTIRSLLTEIRQELREGPADVSATESAEPAAAPALPVADFWSDESAVDALRTAPDPVMEIPDPMEFAEEILAGEITDSDGEDFDFPAFEGYADEVDSFGLRGDADPVPDEELSIPFLSQPLFDADDDAARAETDAPEPAEQENIAPVPVDTQQSLF